MDLNASHCLCLNLSLGRFMFWENLSVCLSKVQKFSCWFLSNLLIWFFTTNSKLTASIYAKESWLGRKTLLLPSTPRFMQLGPDDDVDRDFKLKFVKNLIDNNFCYAAMSRVNKLISSHVKDYRFPCILDCLLVLILCNHKCILYFIVNNNATLKAPIATEAKINKTVLSYSFMVSLYEMSAHEMWYSQIQSNLQYIIHWIVEFMLIND